MKRRESVCLFANLFLNKLPKIIIFYLLRIVKETLNIFMHSRICCVKTKSIIVLIRALVVWNDYNKQIILQLIL